MNDKDGDEPPASSISSDATSSNAAANEDSRPQTDGGNEEIKAIESPDVPSTSDVTPLQVETLEKNGAAEGSDNSITSTLSGVTGKNDVSPSTMENKASTATTTGTLLALTATSTTSGQPLPVVVTAKTSSSTSPPPPPPPPLPSSTAITASQPKVSNSSTTDLSGELPVTRSLADFRNGKEGQLTQEDVQNQANAAIFFGLGGVIDAMTAQTGDGTNLYTATKAVHLGLMTRALGLCEQALHAFGTQGSRRFGGPPTSIEPKTSEATKKTDTGATLPSPPLKPKAVPMRAKPFPDDIIPRLSKDHDVINSSIDVETFSPATYDDGTWNGMHTDSSCSYNTLVLFLMSSKTFVKYLLSTEDLPKKPLHFLLLYIMKKFAFGKECFEINNLGLKEALDTKPHDSPYYTASTDQRDVHELLLQVLDVLMAESNVSAHESLISFIPSEDVTLKSQISLLSLTSEKELANVFSFSMLTTRTCTKCNLKKFSIIPFSIYKVVLPTSFTNVSSSSLSSLIASSVSQTEGERDKSCCSNVDAKVTVTERMCTYPQVLAIEPFRAAQGSLAFAGVLQVVPPPRHTGTIAPEKSITFPVPNSQSVVYDLRSIIVHDEGDGTASGHFRIIFYPGKLQMFDDMGPKGKGTFRNYDSENDQTKLRDAKNGCLYLYEKRQPAASEVAPAAVAVSTVNLNSESSLPPPTSSTSSSSSSSPSASSSVTKTSAGASGKSRSGNKSSKKSSPTASSSATAATSSSTSKTTVATVATGEATTAMLSSFDSSKLSTSLLSTSTSAAASTREQGVNSSTSLMIDTSMIHESKKRLANTPISTTATGECRQVESNDDKDGKIPHEIQKRKTEN